MMVTTRFGRYERKEWICEIVGLPRGDSMRVGWEVTLKVVLDTASRPNIICCSLSDAVVFGFGFSAGTSDERSTTVQCGFDLPRVGRMKARFRESSGMVASTAREVEWVKVMAFL